jgi:hypothetical protein
MILAYEAISILKVWHGLAVFGGIGCINEKK